MTGLRAESALLHRWARSSCRPAGAATPPPWSLSWSLMGQIIAIRPWHKSFIVVLAFAGALLGLFVPVLQKKIIDGLTALQAPASSELIMLASATFFLLIGSRLLFALVRLLGLREGTLVVRWIADRLYSHTLRLEHSSRRKKTIGENVALYTSHVQHLSFFFEEILPLAFSAIVPIIAAPLALSMIADIPMTPIYLTLAVSTALCFILAARQSELFVGDKICDERRLGILNEWLQNIRILRILGWTESFEGEIKQARQQATQQRINVVRNGTLMNSISFVVPSAINCAGIYALLLNEQAQLNAGTLFAVIWTLGVFLVLPIRILPWVVVIYLDAKSSLDRIAEFLSFSAEPEEEEQDIATPPPTITIEDLQLKLEDQTILDGISLQIQAGELVAIVGAVGAGKSALLKALIGELPCQFGRYRMGSDDVGRLSGSALRQYFAFVSQDAFTMSATVQENVRFEFQRDEYKEKEAMASLSLAQFDTDLEALEAGIHTELGERGVNLSGGQRQRLAIARAHFADRPIILLDDSLSALDIHTERQVIDRLILGAWKHQTRIVVTHRFTILPQVDKILFMERGQLLASGTYSELMATNRKFREFISTTAEAI